MNKMKIVHMTSLHSALDVRIFGKECRSLARAGYDVTIVAPHPKDEVVEGVRIKGVPLAKGLSRWPRRAARTWNVLREAQKQHADLYHFHDPDLILAGLYLRLLGKKVIYDIHENVPKDILLKEYLPRWSRPLISTVLGYLELIAGRRFSALITVSPVIAERFLAHNPRTVLVQNFPLYQELKAPAEKSWESRETLVVFPGGLLPERGICEMVNAMAHLPESLGATLEIASPMEFPEGLYRQVTQQPGWERVRFLGRLSKTQVHQMLGRAKVGLVVYLPEEANLCAMPHKLFEYMAAGLPIVASDFPLWRELLGNVGCAVFVNPRNPKDIAQAIQFLLTNDEEAKEMAKRGVQAVRETFNWDSQARELVKLYEGLVDPACAE